MVLAARSKKWWKPKWMNIRALILKILCILCRFGTFCKHFAITFNFYAYHIASNIS